MDYSKNTKKFWRKKLKARGVQALGGKCVICGGVFEDCCYDYHHLDSANKDFTIGEKNTNGARSWLIIRDELKKCALLCSNCHRLVHHGLADIDTQANYFNDAYYEWDFCDIRAVDITTGLSLDKTAMRVCPICGGPKSIRAKNCVKCSNVHTPSYTVSRDELKELIYTTPFTRIGEKFGVTDGAIRKRCRAYGLPSVRSEIKKYSREEWDKI